MIKKVSNYIVNSFLLILISISFLGSCSLLLTDIEQSSKIVIYLMDILIVLIIVLFIKRKQVKIKFKNLKIFLNQHLKFFKIISCILLITWQIIVVFFLTGTIGWDPGVLILKAISPGGTDNYFSNYQNTIFNLFTDHIIWVIFNKPNVKTYTYVLNFINIIIVDFGIFNLYTAQKKYQKESRHVFCLFMLIILFGITPWLCIPYSDCYSFTICTLLLRLFLKYNAKSKFSFFDAITLGIAAFIGYLMKPSLMIMILAFLNVTIVFSKCKKNIIISILIFIIGLFSWNLIKKNNSLVSINPSESFSMYHFIAMGNHGTGAYNDNDVRTDQAIKSYEKRKKHDIKNIENIYSVNGISGMQNFYIRKQVSDTSDGTFAWGGEGNFLRPFRLNNNVLLKLFGKRDHNNFVIGYSSLFEIFEQVAWEFVLLMLFFCLPFDDYISQLLKYIVVGIFMFLLIFEGGRSRYLIQVLPAIIMLSESGFEMIKSHINNMI